MQLQDHFTFSRAAIDGRRSKRPTTESEINKLGIDISNTSLKYSVEYSNYTNEAICISGSNRTKPTRVAPIRQYGSHYNTGNFVIKIVTGNPLVGMDARKNKLVGEFIEIKIPIKDLLDKAFFIDELDSYVFIEGHGESITKFIAEDAIGCSSPSGIIIPTERIRRDPSDIFMNFKALSSVCARRQEHIMIITGSEPKELEKIEISFADTYFNPFRNHRVRHDARLPEDEFRIILNRDSTDTQFNTESSHSFSLSELKEYGKIIVDQNHTETMFGVFYDMVIFVDSDERLNHFHERKSRQRYTEETSALGKITGSRALIEENAQLGHDLTKSNYELEQVKTELTKLKKEKKDLLITIDDIERGGLVDKAKDVVRQKIETSHLQAQNEIFELASKTRISQDTVVVTKIKSLSDTLKSFFTMFSSVIGVATLIIAAASKIKKTAKPV